MCDGDTRNEMSGESDFSLQARDVSGGVHINQPRPSVPKIVPHQLPLAPRQFTDRSAEIAQLDSWLAMASETDQEPDDDRGAEYGMISAITGGAGVGKTTLAVYWAHRVRHLFPDGELYINMRGYDVGPPVGPDTALYELLRALEVPPTRLPTGVDALAALYRSLLHGRRLLIVLDNADKSAQVLPLLPGTPGCAVVVTSRRRLNSLSVLGGARRLSLGVLPEPDAISLLTKIIGPSRVASESATIAALARWCDFLPLALRIAADRAVTNPYTTITELVAELGTERDRLDALATGEDDLTAIRVVFSSSYRGLPSDAAQAFRLIGLHTGPEFSRRAAAALLGVSIAEARRLLDILTNIHLVEQIGRDRFQLHDLLRVYSNECADSEESLLDRHSARRRLIIWYLRTADAVARYLPERHRAELEDDYDEICGPQVFAKREEALLWCETERANLVAAVRAADALGEYALAWQLALAMGSFLNLRKYWTDWIASYKIARLAASNAGEPLAEAWVLTSLGSAYGDLRDFKAAVECQIAALEIFVSNSDLMGEAAAHNNLGRALQSSGQYETARSELQKAVDIYRRTDSRSNEGRARGNLGTALRDLGEYADAIDSLRGAIEILRAAGDRHGEGFTLHNLGDTYRANGEHKNAIGAYEAALFIRRETNNEWGEAMTLYGVGEALLSDGRGGDALAAFNQALAIFDHLGDQMSDNVRARIGTVPGKTRQAYDSGRSGSRPKSA